MLIFNNPFIYRINNNQISLKKKSVGGVETPYTLPVTTPQNNTICFVDDTVILLHNKNIENLHNKANTTFTAVKS